MTPKCPFCGKLQTNNPIKTWFYGKVEVNRYQCKCSKIFNYYRSTTKSWTIPKSKE